MEQNKMGVMPVNKLLISMSLPMMISMLVQALYNIVDSMFVAQLSENALTAVSLAFPAQNLMIAVGTGTGVGVNALISRSLGEKNKERANLIANNGLMLYVISGICFGVFGLFFSGIFFRAQTSDPEIVQLGTDYLRICCLLSTAIFLQFGFERILQATGRTFHTMLTQGLGAIINIIMDPILIFGLFGAPRLGIKGAAIATVFGQVCAASLACWFNKKKNDDIVINPKKYSLNGHAVKAIYSIGVPSICMASIGSIMTFGMNKILIAFTSTAAAVFGVYFKLQSFIFMPVFGMNNGMVPIIGFNYGARKPDRLMATMKLATKYAMTMMTTGTIIFWAFTPQL
ncbi:MAG: MATE family efflux transporter, partial [Anaerotignum sp.]|nr:MATE family efflux transporter [Anaerotignum sp.]